MYCFDKLYTRCRFYLCRKVLLHLASMTEVTPRNSAMVREPTTTTIHSGDESGSSDQPMTKMPDLSETQKLLLSQAVNRSPPSGGDLKQVDSSNASHSDSCSEAEDLKSERKEEVSDHTCSKGGINYYILVS